MEAFKCTKCLIYFASNVELYQHIDENHFLMEEIFKCNKCKGEFSDAEGLKIHDLDDHQSNFFQENNNLKPTCDKCKKSFKTFQGLKSHILQVHDKKNRIFRGS